MCVCVHIYIYIWKLSSSELWRPVPLDKFADVSESSTTCILVAKGSRFLWNARKFTKKKYAQTSPLPPHTQYPVPQCNKRFLKSPPPKKKKTEMTFLKSVPYFNFVWMQGQWDDGSGRILLGANTDGGAVMLRPIRFWCATVRISTALPCIDTCSWSDVYSIPPCAGSSQHATTARVAERL